MFVTVPSTRRSTRERPAATSSTDAVQVVDAALQRDGEVDEILPAAAEQQPLRVADALDLDPRPPGEAEADRADGDADDRHDQCAGCGDVHGGTYPSEKMTG